MENLQLSNYLNFAKQFGDFDKGGFKAQPSGHKRPN